MAFLKIELFSKIRYVSCIEDLSYRFIISKRM